MNLNELNIKEARRGLQEKKFSAKELTEAVFDTIAKKDKEIHAYLSLTKELAVSQAKETDDKIKAGSQLGALAGIPIAIKDNIMVEGQKCTAASKILDSYIAPYDATVIKKLKAAGAVIVGKTNLDEFAMGSSTENSAYGSTKNPSDLTRVPGGSSGGSAAAVASDQCIAALGSDTGGSIRHPASFCGVVGFKPTYGAVSRYGLMAMASSLDQIGPMAKTTEDAQVVFEAIKGQDKMDSTSVAQGLKNSDIDLKSVKIGMPKEYFIKGIDREVETAVKKAIESYQKQGAKIIEISLPHTEYALSCYYIIMSAEISANLARYDGIKYGLSDKADTLMQAYLRSKAKGFGDEVKRRIMLGTYALSAGYYDAYYLKAQKVRSLAAQDFDNAFNEVDVIMTPVAPTPAFKIGEKIDDPLKMYLGDIYTISVNLAGLPAISLPCGQTNQLPIGLQIIGNRFDEKRVLEIAKLYKS